MQRIPRQQRRKIRTAKTEGVHFVRCRTCGKHLRVISGRHLSTHGADRETYMQEYRLSPDKLCSKSFRINHSSRSDYRAHSRREWIAAMKAAYKQHGNVYAGFLQKHYPNLYLEGLWLNGGDWDAALRVLGFTPERMRLRTYWEIEKLSPRYVSYGKKAYLFIRNSS
jgi:ribosomal protein L20